MACGHRARVKILPPVDFLGSDFLNFDTFAFFYQYYIKRENFLRNLNLAYVSIVKNNIQLRKSGITVSDYCNSVGIF